MIRPGSNSIEEERLQKYFQYFQLWLHNIWLFEPDYKFNNSSSILYKKKSLIKCFFYIFEERNFISNIWPFEPTIYIQQINVHIVEQELNNKYIVKVNLSRAKFR